MNIYGVIRSLLGRKENEDLFKYEYNYTYLPPVPLVNRFPGTGFHLGWGVRVALIQFRITTNMLAYVLKQDQDDLLAELDEVEQAFDDGRPIKTLLELCDFLHKLCEKRPEMLKGFASSFKRIVLKMAGKGKISDLLAGINAALFKVDRPYSNLALDFWLLLRDIQIKLLDEYTYTQVESLQAYDDMFRHLPLPEIAQSWREDQAFADMRLTGPNPEMLTRLDHPLPHFPVTQQQFQAVMGSEDDLSRAMTEGRVYITDYQIFSTMVPGTFPGPQKYMGAPIAMFAVSKADGRLKPIAIQCGQRNGRDYPIITPPQSDDPSEYYRWLMAKTWVQISDGNYHEAVTHLGRTHLLVTPFDIASRDILQESHPIGALLIPHFKGTFNINNAAQGGLIAPGGIIDWIMSNTIDMSRSFGALGAQSFLHQFESSYFPKRLSERGVADTESLPYYPYRDCGLKLWEVIGEWVTEYVYHHYQKEEHVYQDRLLQQWYQQLTAHDGGRIQGFGEDGALRTRAYLIEALTMVIFTASAAHAAVNFPQRTIMSYTPAMPLAAYQGPPTLDRSYTEADLLKFLPPVAATFLQLNTGTLLGGIYYTRLGEYPEKHFSDPPILEALARFQASLRALDQRFQETYPEYPYLQPQKIPQSINI